MAMSCAIKHRYSDFIVNEIDEKGQVVWLKPEKDISRWQENQTEEGKEEEEKANFGLEDKLDSEAFKEQLKAEDI